MDMHRSVQFPRGNLHESKFPHIWKESPQMHEVRSIAGLVQISGLSVGGAVYAGQAASA